MKAIFAISVAAVTCGFALSAQAACYSVYNTAGKLINQSTQAPVDTRLQYHLTVPQRFGQGATLVHVADDNGCAVVDMPVQLAGAEFTQVASVNRQGRSRAKADRS